MKTSGLGYMVGLVRTGNLHSLHNVKHKFFKQEKNDDLFYQHFFLPCG